MNGLPTLTAPRGPLSVQTRNSLSPDIQSSALGTIQVVTPDGLNLLMQDIDFGATGANEVFQNVKFILLTEYFSVPLDRQFGMDFTMIDKPMQIAEAMLSQEVAMKIALYEPRCEFREISFDGNAAGGKLAPKVVIEILVTDELPSRYPSVAPGPAVMGAPLTPTITATFADFFTGLLQTSKVPGPPGTQGPPGEPSNVPGPIGPPGVNAFTTTADVFTVPPIGETVQVDVKDDASWIVVGQMLWIDAAGGAPGEAGTLQVTGKEGNTLTLLNPSPSDIPLADSSTDGFLRMVSGLATDFVDGSNRCQDLEAAIRPVIYEVGLYNGYNSLGNPNFEIDQINCGGSYVINGGKGIDRWLSGWVGSMTMSWQQVPTSIGNVCVPGTTRTITSKIFRATLTKAAATLAATDYIQIWANIEGPVWRPLAGGAHNVQLLVRSSVAPLRFSLALNDASGSGGTPTYTLAKVCTIPLPDVWTLISLPDLPGWQGTYNYLDRTLAYYFEIGLAAGANKQVPANDVWVAGNFCSANGVDNFANNPVGSTFDVAFAQHSPGGECGYLLDKPWQTNLDECIRYYEKSYNYFTKAGTANTQGSSMIFYVDQYEHPYMSVRFRKDKPKVATFNFYSGQTGAAGMMYDTSAQVDRAGGVAYLHTGGFGGLLVNTGPPNNWCVSYNWSADSGW